VEPEQSPPARAAAEESTGGEPSPVRIERERLPDGRSITYYSRSTAQVDAADAGPTTTGPRA
jgi:hypothetical protein